MTTLANFVTEFGFRSDGSFERAMRNMQQRLSGLGSSLEANALRSTRALTNRGALAQHSSHVELMQRRQLRMDSSHTRDIIENRSRERAASRVAARERERQHSEALRMNAARERAERQQIARTDQAARRQAADQLRQQRAADRQSAAARRAETTAERQRIAERLRAQRNADRITRQNDAELRRYLNRTGGGQNHNNNRYTPNLQDIRQTPRPPNPRNPNNPHNPFAPLGGIPLMGRTTLGQMAGGFGIAELVRQSYQAANFQARTMPTLKFITKDPTKSEAENNQAAQVEKDFIDRKIKELSLDKMGATKAYTNFAASAYKPLGSKGTQDLFEGAQGIGIMTGRTPAQMELAMKAFGQIKIAV